MFQIPDDQPLKLDNARAWRTYIGGANLNAMHGGEPVISQFPEEWIMSVVEARNAGRENISEGLSHLVEYDNMSLRDVINENPSKYLGQDHYAKYGRNLGVLVKLIDAAERLTVQVHPDKEKARSLFHSEYGKTECWHILGGRTKDGNAPCVYIGFQPGITREKWKNLFEQQDIDGMLQCMHKIPVNPGDTVLILGGVPHAIGEGCLLAEIQEPTDYTIRIERTTPAGLKVADSMCHQGLGFDKMFDCFTYEGVTKEEAIQRWFIPARKVEETPEVSYSVLVGYLQTPLFQLEELMVKKNYHMKFESVFSGIYILEGSGHMKVNDTNVRIQRGEQYFLPAGIKDITIFSSGDESLRILRFFGPKVN